MIRCITNLFKHSDLKIAFKATNTLQQQLSEQQTNKNPSGIYKLKCNACNKAYVGQCGRSIDIRHKEHIRYIRFNNPQSAYAMHILQNSHEYRTTKDTLQLLKTCRKSTRMNYWETLYMHIFHQHKILITEEQIGDINPLYELANTTGILPCNPKPVLHYAAYEAHLANYTLYNRFLRNMVSKTAHNPYSLTICNTINH